jgi:hypothetical protein
MAVQYNNARERKVREALTQLQAALKLEGESGSEALYLILEDAIERVDWSIVERSHEEGLSFDVSWLLTEAIIQATALTFYIELPSPIDPFQIV